MTRRLIALVASLFVLSCAGQATAPHSSSPSTPVAGRAPSVRLAPRSISVAPEPLANLGLEPASGVPRRVLPENPYLGVPEHGREAAARCRMPPRPRPSSIVVTERVLYAKPDGQALYLDLATPSQPGPHPLVVLVHGGGWHRGRRGYMGHTMQRLAGMGYAAATIDYRLASRSRNAFPAAVADARCAVRWLRSNAGRLGVDPDRVGALGVSAGGHIAAMLATASDIDALDDQCPVDGVSPAVQAAVSFYGPYDLRPTEPVGHGTAAVISNFLGRPALDDPARAAMASPISHIDASDAPMLLVHGGRDLTVYIEQGQSMHAALRSAGVPSTLVEIASGGHGFALFPPRSHHRRSTCSTLAFLEEHLGPLVTRPRRVAARPDQPR